jgi:Domain of unknown function (DUF4294)
MRLLILISCEYRRCGARTVGKKADIYRGNMRAFYKIFGVLLCVCFLMCGRGTASAQQGANDTIRLGTVVENGITYPIAFLPEFTETGAFMKDEDKRRINKLRVDIYTVYPYALTASAIFKQVSDSLDHIDRRRDQKAYLKSIDKKLDATFKQPLKELTIDQGHLLIKLISRQTGENCYTIVKELKGGLSAMVWQGVGVFFNNNLKHQYDPQGDDREVEQIVQQMEESANYRYMMSYQQEQLMKKAGVSQR